MICERERRGPGCRRGRAGRRSGSRARRAAGPRRSRGSARRGDLLVFQSENGCVPAAAMRRPFCVARRMSSPRSSSRRARTSATFVADAGADLDDRLVHLRLDALLEEEPALLEDLLDVGAQLARLRIDDLELLLDAEREGRAFRASTRPLLRSCLAAGQRGGLARSGRLARLGRRLLGRRGRRRRRAGLAGREERLPAVVRGSGRLPRATRSISHRAACSSDPLEVVAAPTECDVGVRARGSGSRSRTGCRRGPRTRACRSRSRAR